MTETNTTDTTPRTPEAIAETLTSLGRDWAAYGLKLAQQALEQSAGTMGKVAAALDGLRHQVEKTPPPSTDPRP